MECHLKPQEGRKDQLFYRNSSSKPLQIPVEQCMKKRIPVERELVKYMSKVPGFLERTETPQDKLLNVGVLNWVHLEKWQHSHTHNDPSDTHSSALSTRKAQTRSSVHQRTQHNSLQFHLMSTPPEERSKIMKSHGERRKECRNRISIGENNFKDHRCLDEQLCQGTAAPRLDKDLNDKICPNGGLKPNMEITSKTRKHRRGKHEDKLNESNGNDYQRRVDRTHQGSYEFYDSTKKLAQNEAKPRSKSSSTKGSKGICHAEVDYYSNHRSCSLPCDVDNCRDAKVRSEIGSGMTDKNRVLVKMSQPVPSEIQSNAKSSRDKITEDKRSALLSRGQDSNLCNAESENGRKISPFQRLSSTTGQTSKHNGERSAIPITRLNLTVNATESGSRNVTATSSGIDSSDCKNSSGKDRDVISPFRRLLEPLLKSKSTQTGNTLEDHQRIQRVKLGINGCKTVNVDDSAQEKRVISSIVQAVLRVTVKNNQLLFTFAVNKESNILAATVKKVRSFEGNECTDTYNFFYIEEHKKNGSWLKQRSKGQTHGIISNVFAQMRVSSLPSGSIREFVLFSVDYEKESELKLKNELAAIVMKIPMSMSMSSDISATVILQSGGVHSLPHKGGPSSLIQRWRSGGCCDCGGWDIGCNLRVLSNRSNKNQTSSEPLDLFFQGVEGDDEEAILSLRKIKEGIYSIGYNSSLSLLQAFAISIAISECRQLSRIVDDEHNKASSADDDEEVAAGKYMSYPPPLSPVGRV